MNGAHLRFLSPVVCDALAGLDVMWITEDVMEKCGGSERGWVGWGDGDGDVEVEWGWL